MTVAAAILALYPTDDVVLYASAIIKRTGRKENSIRVALKRMRVRGEIFKITHGQYARVPTARPLSSIRRDRIFKLERRIGELEARIAVLEERWAQRGPQP